MLTNGSGMLTAWAGSEQRTWRSSRENRRKKPAARKPDGCGSHAAGNAHHVWSDRLVASARRIVATVDEKDVKPERDWAAIRGRTSGKIRRPQFRGRGRLFVLVAVVLAAELLELGENGADVEFAGLFLSLGGGHLGFPLGGGLGGRQQRRAGIGRRRLFLVGALHFEVEIDLRAQAERHRVHRREARGIPVRALADRGDGGLGGADQTH